MIYYKSDIKETLGEVKTSFNGLTEQEASKRLIKNGENKLIEKEKETNLIKFLNQFKNLMVIILLIAALVSFGVAIYEGESLTEGFIILLIVILNAFLGFFQELKADKAIEALAKMSVTEVKVKRDGIIKVVPATELVVGDILVLEAGDYVQADARVISEYSLKVDEAALTGESVAVRKTKDVIKSDAVINERKNMVYFGSNVVYGKGEAVVVETGMKTELGKIADSLNNTVSEMTPLQKKIHNISKVLTLLIMIIIVIMFFIGLSNGDSVIDVFIVSISLAVAAIPEGLPAVITISLSLGMTTLAKNNAIVRKIASVETLGSTEVICSDKTGTITQNKMTIRKVYSDNKVSSDTANLESLRTMYYCNNVSKNGDEYLGDPTEIALYQFSESFGSGLKGERVFEFPFDSERKMMSVIVKDSKKKYVYTKGSLEALLTKCNYILSKGKVTKLTAKKRNEILLEEESFSNEALRVLGLAYKETSDTKYKIDNIENDLIFVGFAGMIDPPREHVLESIKTCYEAGLKPIMITGDSLNTAMAIAKEVGIYKKGDLALSGLEIEAMSDEALAAKIGKVTVYARVSPEHKLRIVKAWQATGKVVAMTGDGVNDAPAIKLSDVGIGMGITGTEVSKNVSDIVLADDSFNTIVVAIKEGRNIYENIRKSITYLLTANIAEVMIVFIAMLYNTSIFLPIHLLFINLVTDSIPAIALSFEKNGDDLMKRKVRENNNTIFTPFITSRIVVSSIIKAVAVLIVYFSTANVYGSGMGTTIAFFTLILLEMIYALSCRNLHYSIVNNDFFANKYMNLSMILLVVIQFIVFATPVGEIFEIEMMGSVQYLYSFVVVLGVFIVGEAIKPILTKLFRD